MQPQIVDVKIVVAAVSVVGSDGKEVYNDTVYFSRGLKLVDFLNKKLWK